MKKHKPYEQLKAEATQIVTAFNILSAIKPVLGTLLNEEGQIKQELYETISDLSNGTDTAEQFIAKAYKEYTGLVEHYNRLSTWEREHTWNNPKVFKSLRRYVIRNFPVELRLNYPEFLSLKEV